TVKADDDAIDQRVDLKGSKNHEKRLQKKILGDLLQSEFRPPHRARPASFTDVERRDRPRLCVRAVPCRLGHQIIVSSNSRALCAAFFSAVSGSRMFSSITGKKTSGSRMSQLVSWKIGLKYWGAISS